MKITRGTTPIFNFTLPFSTADISDFYITFMQNGEVLVEKGLSDVVIVDVDVDTEDSAVTDVGIDDSIDSNDQGKESTTYEEEALSMCTVHLTQEDTLSFKFYPAAEKNIIIVQIRILDGESEAYASDPIQFRLYGVLKEGVIPVIGDENEETQ